MNLSVELVRSIFDRLLCGEMPREEASKWAGMVRDAEDRGTLIYDPIEMEEALWKVASFIEGYDLENGPGEYLYGDEDLAIAIAQFEARVADSK